jgi:hypothetical protein
MARVFYYIFKHMARVFYYIFKHMARVFSNYSGYIKNVLIPFLYKLDWLSKKNYKKLEISINS